MVHARAMLCCAVLCPGHVAVERYLESEGLPFTVFQPLYIYGPHTAKDCEQWFLDRIMRWAILVFVGCGTAAVCCYLMRRLGGMCSSVLHGVSCQLVLAVALLPKVAGRSSSL